MHRRKGFHIVAPICRASATDTDSGLRPCQAKMTLAGLSNGREGTDTRKDGVGSIHQGAQAETCVKARSKYKLHKQGSKRSGEVAHDVSPVTVDAVVCRDQYEQAEKSPEVQAFTMVAVVVVIRAPEPKSVGLGFLNAHGRINMT